MQEKKAGIIKQQCPVIVGQLTTEAQEVIQAKAQELECQTIWVEPAEKIQYQGEAWARYEEIEYPLVLAGDIQLQNSALAIATIKILQQQGWSISAKAIREGMKSARWRGRIEWINWQGVKLLIDGAHNVAAAKVLRAYIDTLDREIIWVMGMLSTKDHQGVLQKLLRPKEQLHLVPVPDHSTAQPQELAIIAQQIVPDLGRVTTYPDLFDALKQVKENFNPQKQAIVICGSLYLLGYFLAHYQQ